MRKLLRAALCRTTGPAAGGGGRSLDEDPFTVAATAIEWATAGVRVGSAPLGLDLLGEFPTSMEWALPAVLGTPVRVLRSAGSARGLFDALRRAVEEREGRALVVAVDVPSGSSLEAGPGRAAGFLFGDSDGSDLSQGLDGLPEDGSAVDAALALFRNQGAGTRDPRWTGAWEAPTATAPTPDRSPSGVPGPPSTDRVSQGAYVPRARYLENLPSRWRFVAERCPICGAVTFPARGKCRNCGERRGLEPEELPRDRALVVATTVIGSGGQPTEFDPQVEAFGPYAVVLAELAPGARVTLQLTDALPGQVRIGDQVDTRLRRLYAMDGEWRYGRKAVPRASARPLPS